MKDFTSIQISKDLHNKLKLCCVKRNVKIYDFCELALEKVIKEYDNGDVTHNFEDGKYVEYFPIKRKQNEQ